MITTNPIPVKFPAALALQFAQSQLGQREQPKGSNRGPMVDKYLRSVGLNPGYAWCQAFVHWCYEQAAAKAATTNPMIKTAGVYDCWNRTETHTCENGNKIQKLTKTEALSQPQLITPGTQFILLFGKGAGHTGIVEKIEGHMISTIEGNSNSTGARDGYEVVRNKRTLNDKALEGFIIYS